MRPVVLQMGVIPKVVFSKTLTRAKWAESRIADGYEVVGSVPETPLGQLTMLKLPGDEFVTIELVHDPAQGQADTVPDLSHFVIQVESLDATISELAARGIGAEAPVSPDGSDDFRTTWVIDPDGNRIELVQWPAGHADGITAADWAG
jgi:lactoylglutathione lyase